MMSEDLRRIIDVRINGNDAVDELLERMRVNALDSLGFEYIDRMNCALRYSKGVLLASLLNTDNETLRSVFESAILPSYRYLESLKIIEDAFLLALSGRYLSAGAVIRTSLESMVVGAFYHGLTDSNHRGIADVLRRKLRNSTKSFLDFVEESISDIPEERLDGEILEASVELKLLKHDPPLAPPSFRTMFYLVRDWGYFGPLAEDANLVFDKLYDGLSEYTHAMRGPTSYSRALLSKKQYSGFFSGEVNEESLEKLCFYYLWTLNVIGSVFFTVFWEVFKSEEAQKQAIWFQRMYESYSKDLATLDYAVLLVIEKARKHME